MTPLSPLRLPARSLDAISQTITRYNLLPLGSKVVVALSGGKDSMFLCAALKELGYQPSACIIDVGYEPGWGTRVANAMSSLAVPLDVVDLDSLARDDLTHGPTAADLSARLTQLRGISIEATPNVTPCTQCFNSKSIGLRLHARRLGAEHVAFGHHAKDAIASMLKLALMYVDANDRGNREFERKRFSALVDELRAEILKNSSIPTLQGDLSSRLGELARQRLTSTDEPPRQALAGDPSISLIRPMMRVWEEDVVRHRDASQFATEGSGCGHGATRQTESPREMVHYRVLSAIPPEGEALRVLEEMLEWVEVGISSDGSLISNIRNARAQLLGAGYKPNAGCAEKL